VSGVDDNRLGKIAETENRRPPGHLDANVGAKVGCRRRIGILDAIQDMILQKDEEEKILSFRGEFKLHRWQLSVGEN